MPEEYYGLQESFCYTRESDSPETTVKDPVRPLPRGASVKDDWRAWLPQEKSQVFHKQVHRLESSYAMFSVLLDEAIELRQLGHSGKSRQAVGITSGLSKLLTQTLQFLHKLSTLGDMVEDLGREFRHAADDLAEGTSLNPKKMWAEVDAGHYDLNTCLREAIVVFKSFLIVLPESQLAAFQDTVRQQSQPQEADVPSRQGVIRHRRMTPTAGEGSGLCSPAGIR